MAVGDKKYVVMESDIGEEGGVAAHIHAAQHGADGSDPVTAEMIGAIPYIEVADVGNDMGAVLKGGVHCAFYGVTGGTKGTPNEEGLTTLSIGKIFSCANAAGTYGFQMAFYQGYAVPFMRRLNNGTISRWSTGFLPLAGGTLTGALTLAANPSNEMHAATKKYVDTAALPVISGESSATDMDSIIKSGKHMALYYTDGNTLGTPYKYGAVPANYRRAAILSYSGFANYGFQIAIPNGLPYLLMRRLDNGKFYMPDGVTEDPKGNWYKLYSEINPPTLADIGAAPAYTYGTEDIAEGSASTAPEGALHFIYEA